MNTPDERTSKDEEGSEANRRCYYLHRNYYFLCGWEEERELVDEGTFSFVARQPNNNNKVKVKNVQYTCLCKDLNIILEVT